MRKVEKEMWRHIMGKTSGSLAKGNLEVLPLDGKIFINCYQCRLAVIEPLKGSLKVTFKGECWDGASATVMGRVRALAVGYKVSKSSGNVTFEREDLALKQSKDVAYIAEEGFSILVDIEKVRLATQP
jgi:hypothetical protein